MGYNEVLTESAYPGWGMDGAKLHEEVSPDSWCVTKHNLLAFKRSVRAAIAYGMVAPTERDQFDPFDHSIGPNMYTVNEQFITKVTAQAGNMSWALMCHPYGLLCDLFITHAWQEGMYEFCHKALHSWPGDCKHAYVCFLAN